LTPFFEKNVHRVDGRFVIAAYDCVCEGSEAGKRVAGDLRLRLSGRPGRSAGPADVSMSARRGASAR
jgi:hypothetical protein